MTEKRKYQRYGCKLKTNFEYFEGNPENIDISTSIPEKGKGFILDISQGGLFIITNERVTVGNPINVNITTKKNNFQLNGTIVRIGLLKNNPSEVAKKFSKFSAKGDSYIAVEFKEQFSELREEDIY